MYISPNQKFELKKGEISGNTGVGYGGGVHTYKNFTMKDGEISGNSSTGVGGAMGVGGLYSGGTSNNVFLSENKLISVTAALTNDASVDVTMQTPGVFTSGLSGHGTAANFTNSNYSCRIVTNSGGEAALEIIPRVSGILSSDGKLTAVFTAPKDSVIFAAAYESSGRMADVKSLAITELKDGESYTFNKLAAKSGYTYKLFLLNADSSEPLCAASSTNPAPGNDN